MEEFDKDKEYEIGEQISFEGHTLTIVSSSICEGCFFYNKCKDYPGEICNHNCGFLKRKDKTDIIYYEQ